MSLTSRKVIFFGRKIGSKVILCFLSVVCATTTNAQLCNGSLGDPVVKIDFGSGSGRGAALGSSFTSYTYSASGFPNDGYYTIANTTSGLLSSWWTTYDHDYQTTGNTNGYMMIVNASLSVTDYFFKDTVKGLCAGTTYEFAAWILNLFNNGNTVYPNLTFNIYDATSGATLGTYSTGDIKGSTTAIDWVQYGLYFTATTNSVVLKITNNKAGAAPGNDLALDDITFRPCGAKITSTVSDGSTTKEICLGAASSVQLISSFSGATANTRYQWQVSTDGGVTWSDIAGATSATYTPTGITVSGTYLYRIVTAEGSNINSATCRVTSDPVTLIVDVYSAASLLASYVNCDNYTFNFSNQDTSTDISNYLWTFGDGNTSQTAAPSHTYADTGTYALTLKVTNSKGCSDTAGAVVKVFPGFTPDFSVSGSCYLSPFQFTDKSYAQYGAINNWSWNFGDAAAAPGDTSDLQNPSYTFSSTGSYTVSLAVTSSKGCSGTVTKTVTAYSKPSLYLPFTDTLICSNDTLPLPVQTSAPDITWSPSYNMVAATIHKDTALVYPYDTTIYKVVVQENGCTDSATVQVNVLPFITVRFNADTGICKTDTITLHPISYALSYLWKESPDNNSLSNNAVKNPLAYPDTTTTYYVKANLGHCQDSSQVTVFVSPYPLASVLSDTSVCYGTSAQLTGVTNAPYYSWSPASLLENSNTLTPVTSPLTTTTIYYLTVHDTTYCTKNVTASAAVTVIPELIINAGNDTSVVINQPLQLNATGGSTSDLYVWSPATGLNDPSIYDPVGTYYASDPDSVLYTVTVTTPEGCVGSDNVLVKIYKFKPDILVPSGFTPNGDGLNDILKPLLFGISKFNFFKVYNRYGQLVYATTKPGEGWDGTFKGLAQDGDVYVYVTEGIDYLGNVILKKGSVLLIR